MKVVTLEDKKKMNELYLELKTYAAVSRATGFSPSTVKRYIDPNFKPTEEREIQRYEGNLPDFDLKDAKAFICDWDRLCELSEEEVEEIKKLWGELDV